MYHVVPLALLFQSIGRKKVNSKIEWSWFWSWFWLRLIVSVRDRGNDLWENTQRLPLTPFTLYGMMEHREMLTVKRVAVIEPGAFSVLLWNGVPFALGLERTYENLQLKIPLGPHRCTRTTYFKGGYETFELRIPGHTRILFHKGNVETELDGCVAIGEEFGTLNGKPAILQSGRGFGEFMSLTSGLSEFMTKVENP